MIVNLKKKLYSKNIHNFVHADEFWLNQGALPAYTKAHPNSLWNTKLSLSCDRSPKSLKFLWYATNSPGLRTLLGLLFLVFYFLCRCWSDFLFCSIFLGSYLHWTDCTVLLTDLSVWCSSSSLPFFCHGVPFDEDLRCNKFMIIIAHYYTSTTKQQYPVVTDWLVMMMIFSPIRSTYSLHQSNDNLKHKPVIIATTSVASLLGWVCHSLTPHSSLSSNFDA